MNPTSRLLTQGLYEGQTTAEGQGLNNFVAPLAYRPQWKRLLIDIRATGQNPAATMGELQDLLDRCHAQALYDGPHPLHLWRKERVQCANAVVQAAEERGFIYNQRARQFRAA